MYNGLLGIHSLFRWIILLLLIVNIFRSAVDSSEAFTNADKKWNLRLLIIAHINLLIGLYQYFAGPKGFVFIREYGMGEVMKNSVMRFWAVEHITGMIIAIVLITISRSVAKKEIAPAQKNKKLLTLYVIALVVILASVPWPFRFSDVPWFRGLY
ncbi:MAG: hypothetical protein KGO81_02010 [Bacteroidota bacterium]|nr:hypothetical protein [Bacteroidota bacterium]